MKALITLLTAFAAPFSGIVGLTLMSTVFNNRGGDTVAAARDDIRWAYVAIIPFVWACVLLTTFLGNVWICKDGGYEVVNGACLRSLVFGKRLERSRGDMAQVAAEAAAAAKGTPVADDEKGVKVEGGPAVKS